MFAKLTVKARLTVGFGLLFLLFIVVIGLAINSFAQLKNEFVLLADHRVPNMTMAEDWQRYLQDAGLKMRNIMIVNSSAEISAQLAAMQEDRAKRREILAALSKSITIPEAKLLLAKASDARDVYLPLETRFVELVEAGNMGAAKELLLGQVRPAQIANINAIAKLVEFEKQVVAESRTATETRFNSYRIILLIAGLVSMLIAVAAGYAILRSILEQLGGEPSEALRMAEKISEGELDLDIALKQGDQSSLLFNLDSMRSRIRGVLSDVHDGASHVTTGTRQIAQGNDDLSQRTQEQAAALEETAASMEQMTATVKQNAENANQARRLASSALNEAERGGIVVNDAIKAMVEINDSSRKIADIISVIDEIAFQTNLLALNAAVEAARAGEQGRGFAVVASEVRNLAQRSATAAKEIKLLINTSVVKVKAGSELVNTSGATLTEIISGVKRVADIVAEIVAASDEQSSGIEQINNAITQMDTVTQQNAALVEEASAASKSIEDKAYLLQQRIAYFKLKRNDLPQAQRLAPVTPMSPARRTQPASTPPKQQLRKVSGESWQEF